MHDLLLRGGTIIDGTGAAARVGDVGVRGGKIAVIGALANSASRQTLDARGLVVAPGFIDVHNHSDGWLLRERCLLSKTSQGFTTEVLMSDGISYAPVAPETIRHWLVYLRALDALRMPDYTGWQSLDDYRRLLDRRSVHHSALQAPYANIRTLAMGWGPGRPDDTQMRIIQQQIAEALDGGAVALSTGLDYIGQWHADTDELVEACRPLAEFNRPYVTHVRYKKGLLPALMEAVEIGRRARVPVHISHLKAETAAMAERVLEYIDRVATSEVDFTFDTYPYLPGSTMLHFLLPYEVFEQGPLGVLPRLNRPGVRRRFAELLKHPARCGLDQMYLAWVATADNRQHLGKPLSEYVASTGNRDADALCDLLIEENLAALVVFRLGDDTLVEPFLRHPRAIIASDGIFHQDGPVHPRQYGTATRAIGPLVRDRRVFSLEEAVHKLTAAPARRFGLKGRGAIEPGAAADLAVFDAATVSDRATFEHPHQVSTGMRYVIAGGTLIFQDGQEVELPEESLPGRSLRWGQ